MPSSALHAIDFLAHEVPPLVVAALAQLHRAPSSSAARRRQRRGRRVVPARRERAAERRDAPRPDQVRPPFGM